MTTLGYPEACQAMTAMAVPLVTPYGAAMQPHHHDDHKGTSDRGKEHSPPPQRTV